MTVVETKEVGDGKYYKEMLGLSSETKPTLANTPSGQKFDVGSWLLKVLSW